MEILGQEINEFFSVSTYVAVAARKSEGAVWVVDSELIMKKILMDVQFMKDRYFFNDACV